MSDDVIRTEGLTKRYPGGVLAVDRLDLTVRQGDLYGFLGPNGAGKTTVVRMLLGLVYATSGRIEVLGQRIPRHARRVLPQVGALIEGPAFYAHQSGRTNLRLYDAAGPGGPRRTRGQRVDDALEQVGLQRVAGRAVRAYSLGMKQRLGLAAALLRAPKLLVLDEPTNGLDPHGIREVRDLLVQLNRAGTTVFLSSHLLAEVELVCSRAGIVYGGRLVAEEEVSRLLAPTGRVGVRTPDGDAATAVLRGLRGPRLVQREPDHLLVHLDGMGAAELNSRLVEAGVRVEELVVERPTLEEVFLELTAASEVS